MKTQVTVQQKQKLNEINWDVPQLVTCEKMIVQTTGIHSDDEFHGIVLDTGGTSHRLFSHHDDWAKRLFRPFYGSITLTNVNE